jgi:hypothetical protein
MDPVLTQKNDKYKMKCANENGYSVIRLLQKDVWRNSNDWQNNLKKSIKKYDNPTNIFFGNCYDNYKAIDEVINEVINTKKVVKPGGASNTKRVVKTVSNPIITTNDKQIVKAVLKPSIKNTSKTNSDSDNESEQLVKNMKVVKRVDNSDAIKKPVKLSIVKVHKDVL